MGWGVHSQRDPGGKGRDLGARHSGFHLLLKLSKILTSEYVEGLLRKDKSVHLFTSDSLNNHRACAELHVMPWVGKQARRGTTKPGGGNTK